MRTDPLVLAYPIRIRRIIIGVLFTLAALMWAFPRFLDEPGRTSQGIPELPQIVVDLPPNILDVPPEPPSRPAVPVAVDDWDETDLLPDFPEIDFGEFEGILDPTPPGSIPPRRVFIPYTKEPELISSFHLEYPKEAIECKIEGTVWVSFYVDEKGKLHNIYIEKGIPNTGLDEAAINAIRQTKWKPAMSQDKKVGVWLTQPIRFTLD